MTTNYSASRANAATQAELGQERFYFTIFLSTIVHAIVILGVGFSYFNEVNSEPALDITLAQYRSDAPPENADFLAQENQQGSGSADEILAPSTPVDADFHDDRIQEVAPQPTAPESSPAEINQQDIVTTTESNRFVPGEQEDVIQEEELPPGDELSPEELSLAIASLQAQLDTQRQEYANRPRKYTISSASTQKSHDALYLDSWRKRIETVGNQNYPRQAREQELYGSLRILVAIELDGEVSEIRILQSSGLRILDEAAIAIVNMAAPFEPLPAEIRAEADILEIIRTWRFHEDNALSSF